jgi:hypothetical protein
MHLGTVFSLGDMHRFLKWRDAISMAPDHTALAKLMVEYVETIAPDLRERLPMPCQRVLKHPDDISSAAVTLLQTELTYRGDPEIGTLLHEVAHTFASAAFRVGQLNNRPDIPIAPS